MEGLESLQSLEKLELYDNVIEKFDQLEYLPQLLVLDISFNSIKDMSPVRVCRHLKELYIAQNKLKEIQGLEDMKSLRILDLGANRIRSMDGIQGLVSLESLWLGKNKIEEIAHVGGLPILRQLDVQSNRLRSLGDDLGRSQSLQELYLAHNAITSTIGLPLRAPLTTIDLSYNKTKEIDSLASSVSLEELWMSGSMVEMLEELLVLKSLSKLTCLYLEHSPVAKIADYRNQIKSMFPNLQQLDADLFAV
jgi:protein phosphatase 1 regulatory subunit 7